MTDPGLTLLSAVPAGGGVVTGETTKTLRRALSGSSNIRFTDMVALLEGFGWRQARVKGSHHIFVHGDVKELLNLQNAGGKAKPYQVRQFLELVERYNLKLKGDE